MCCHLVTIKVFTLLLFFLKQYLSRALRRDIRFDGTLYIRCQTTSAEKKIIDKHHDNAIFVLV